MAQAIEKDYYVAMLLRLLSEKMPYIVFKGGTSLSKCHKVIQRFSEDIDITIDTQISQGQKKAIKQAIISSANELGMNIENLDETRSRRDYNRYIISYDSVLSLANDTLNPSVLLETSYTAVSFPTILAAARCGSQRLTCLQNFLPFSKSVELSTNTPFSGPFHV